MDPAPTLGPSFSPTWSVGHATQRTLEIPCEEIDDIIEKLICGGRGLIQNRLENHLQSVTGKPLRRTNSGCQLDINESGFALE